MTSAPSAVAADPPDAVLRVSLADAVASAVARNPLVRSYQEDVARAKAEIDVQSGVFVPALRINGAIGQARTISGLPVTDDGRIDQLYGEAGAGLVGRWTFGTEYDVGFSTSIIDSDYDVDLLTPRYESSVALSIAQPLLRDLGFRVNRAPIRAAELGYESEQADYASRVEALVAETARRYWLWSVALAGVKVTKNAQTLGEEQLRATQIRAKAGAISPLEVAQAEATVAQREDDRRAAESAATQAEATFLAVSYLQSAPEFDWKKPLEPIESEPEPLGSFDIEAHAEKAVARRHPIRLQQKLIAAHEQLVIAAEDRVWPRLDLVGRAALIGVAGTPAAATPPSAEFLSGKWPSSLANLHRGPLYEIGLRFQVPLDNSTAEGEAEQARRALAQSRIRLEELMALVRLDIRKSWQQLQEEHKRYAAALEAERLTQINVDAEKKKFAAGISTTFDVLRSQDELSRARINTSRALANLQLATIALKLADGTLLETLGISTQLPDE